jgi:uncharacterized membrane protein YvlD (DUF360 family)
MKYSSAGWLPVLLFLQPHIWFPASGGGSGCLESLYHHALILGLVNALIRPLLTVMSCPLIILTLGVFTWWSTLYPS